MTRRARVVATARDRHGRRLRITGEDLLARALQHEIDHLDRRLYLDRMESLDELIPLRVELDATKIGRTPAR